LLIKSAASKENPSGTFLLLILAYLANN